MKKNTKNFPSESDELFLTDGGLETTLIFLEGFDLPCFAAFDLMKTEKGYDALRNYYRKYLEIAKKHHTSFILETPTWRANPDWVEKTGYPRSSTSAINKKAVALMKELKTEFENDLPTILISGCIGPRGDGYFPENTMISEEAQQYHSHQIEALKHSSVDLVTALTLQDAEEAIGVTRAANYFTLPAVISFTVETDGKLPNGMSLAEVIKTVDENTDVPPLYYMINCAHPTHFHQELLKNKNDPYTRRIKAIRANASCKSHAELDEATSLDRGIPHELGKEYKNLKESFTHINVFGGCCGTDEEHISEIISQIHPASV